MRLSKPINIFLSNFDSLQFSIIFTSQYFRNRLVALLTKPKNFYHDDKFYNAETTFFLSLWKNPFYIPNLKSSPFEKLHFIIRKKLHRTWSKTTFFSYRWRKNFINNCVLFIYNNLCDCKTLTFFDEAQNTFYLSQGRISINLFFFEILKFQNVVNFIKKTIFGLKNYFLEHTMVGTWRAPKR